MPDRALDELLDQAIDGMFAGPVAGTFEGDLDSLVRIAGTLREMPAEDFQARLGAELQRSATMTATATAPVREGFRTITPYITVPDGARLIDFLKHTFGAEEVFRATMPGGFHAEVRIGDSMLMVGSGESLRGRENIGAFHVYVADCDAAYARAMEAGATSLGAPANHHYGERGGNVKDFSGNVWYIATRFAPAPLSEGLGTITPSLHPAKARPLIEFLQRAFGAEETAWFEDGGRVVYATVRIGDAVLEMGEAHGPWQSMPSMFLMYVDNCDAWYQRAIAAGATSLTEPSDQPYGRTAAVIDPFGYRWHPTSPLKPAHP